LIELREHLVLISSSTEIEGHIKSQPAEEGGQADRVLREFIGSRFKAEKAKWTQ